ncbi:MAG: Sua5/YciO/YrdC/YwlC family protein [Candidatus Woesearchaeota archaeon]|nr:Sua5/YciO/YrdC/YwlC family protein [Candidatus Woesearchaeota archaeon]
MKQVNIFDTTLRDGEQGANNRMTIAQKIEVAKALDKLGINTIEAGFPAACYMEYLAAQEISRLNLNAKLCVFSRLHQSDIDAAHYAIKSNKNAQIELATVGSDILINKLGWSKEQTIENTIKAAQYAKQRFQDVAIGIEDATRADYAFFVKLCEESKKAGANSIVIADTLGHSQPEEFRDLIKKIKAHFKDSLKISVHMHNDLGLAVANTLAAIKAGVDEIQTTINGVGERSGNCALEEIIAASIARPDFYNFTTNIKPKLLFGTSKLVYTVLGRDSPCEKAVVGKTSFTTLSGTHQKGILKNTATYELFDPNNVGRERLLKQGKYSSSELGDANVDREVKRAYAVLKEGGLILVPSDVGYVLLGNSEEAIKKMYELKGRPEYKPCMVIGNNQEIFDDVTYVPIPTYEKYIRSIKEAGYLCSFLVPINPRSRQWYGALSEWVLNHTVQDGKIAVPFNPGNVIEALAQLSTKDKVLIVGSSANNTGEGNCAVFEELPVQMVNNVDYIIYDSKPAKYQNPERKGGTIIDLSSGSPVVFRKGVLFEKIYDSLNLS